MKVDKLFERFTAFHEAFCFDKALCRPDTPFRFDKEELEEADLIREWNIRAEHWQLSVLGSALNLQAFFAHFNANFHPGEYLLSVGSGTGVYETFLGNVFKHPKWRNIQVIGVDNAVRMTARHAELINKCELDNVTALTAAADQLPFYDSQFDHIICIDAIQWMPNWRAVIREIARVMKPVGHRRAYFTVHEKLRGCHLRRKAVAINDATLLKLEEELLLNSFRIEEVFPVDGGSGLGQSQVGTMAVAKFKPNQKR